MSNEQVEEKRCPYSSSEYYCSDDCNECPIPHEYREDSKEGWCWSKSKTELDKIEKKFRIEQK
jgi:hypothetical protein